MAWLLLFLEDSYILARVPPTMATGRYFGPATHGCSPIRPNSQTIGHQFVKAD
jgi:hypothetical protein